MHHPAVGLHLDLDDFGIVGAGEHPEQPAAARALRVLELDQFVARGQFWLQGAAMSRGAALMAARALNMTGLITAHATPFVARMAFGLVAKQALLQIPDTRLCVLQLRLKRRLALRA